VRTGVTCLLLNGAPCLGIFTNNMLLHTLTLSVAIYEKVFLN